MTFAVCLNGASTNVPRIIKRDNYNGDIEAIDIPDWCELEDYNEEKKEL